MFLFIWCEVKEFELVEDLEFEVEVVRDEDAVWTEFVTILDAVIFCLFS